MKLIGKMKEEFHQVIKLFYGEDVTEEQAKEAMRLAANKLPIKCKFVKKADLETEEA